MILCGKWLRRNKYHCQRSPFCANFRNSADFSKKIYVFIWLIILVIEIGHTLAHGNALVHMRHMIIHAGTQSALFPLHVIMGAMTSQITSVSIVCSTVCSGTDQRKHQSSTSLALVRGIHRWPVNSPHKGPVTRKLFPFDDVIMSTDYFGSDWWMGCVFLLIGWLAETAGRFMKWLVQCLVGWLGFDWLIDWLVGWLIDWSIDWLVGWLVDGWMDGWIGWLIDWLIDWQWV